MRNTKFPLWATSGMEGGAGIAEGHRGSSISSVTLRFDRDSGCVGIYLVFIPSECLNYVLFFFLKKRYFYRESCILSVATSLRTHTCPELAHVLKPETS